jgi:hypothetical protein
MSMVDAISVYREVVHGLGEKKENAGYTHGI